MLMVDFLACVTYSSRILSLVYTTQESHRQAKRSPATMICVHSVIAALEHSAAALT